eukprot:PLAT8319.1.p1 GENE.PLAT8319.1~~PLAT8319.1.p1  ORF type:complete len:439 (+),score=111.89 PLAT8319.1:88-1404(+)
MGLCEEDKCWTLPEAYPPFWTSFIAWVGFHLTVYAVVLAVNIGVLRRAWKGLNHASGGKLLRVYILVLNMVAILTRLLCLLDPREAATWAADMWPLALQILLWELPRYLWIFSFLLLILFWNDLVDSTTRLKSTMSLKRLFRWVFLLCSALVLVSLPLSFLSAYDIGGDSVGTFATILFSLYGLLLLGAGSLSVYKIQKLCKHLPSSTSIVVLRRVRDIILFANALAVVMVVAKGINVVRNDSLGDYILYWWMTYTSEALFATMLILAVSSGRRRKTVHRIHRSSVVPAVHSTIPRSRAPRSSVLSSGLHSAHSLKAASVTPESTTAAVVKKKPSSELLVASAPAEETSGGPSSLKRRRPSAASLLTGASAAIGSATARLFDALEEDKVARLELPSTHPRTVAYTITPPPASSDGDELQVIELDDERSTATTASRLTP